MCGAQGVATCTCVQFSLARWIVCFLCYWQSDYFGLVLQHSFENRSKQRFYLYMFFFCSQWYNILNRVHRATEEELKGMREESANVKHAVVRRSRLLSFFHFVAHFMWRGIFCSNPK